MTTKTTHEKQSEKQTKKTQVTTEIDNALWDKMGRNYELIEGAQMSNSFVILQVLSENEGRTLSTTDISQLISKNSKGQIFRIASTLKETLDNRLRREGYVEGIDIPNEHFTKKPTKATMYKITPKGKKLLACWRKFLEGVE